jgi:hypothetical protein
LASLRPHLSMPKQVRAAYAAALPCIVGSWALGGFYLSLGPSLVAGQLKSTNLVWGGLSIFLLCGIGAATAVTRSRQAPRRIMLEGCIALVAGGAVSLAAIASRSPAAFLVGTIIAGLGFGPAYLGAFRTVVPLALAAGLATSSYGLRPTSLVYCAAVVVLEGIAAVTVLLRRRAPDATTGADSVACLPTAPCTRAHYLPRPVQSAVSGRAWEEPA